MSGGVPKLWVPVTYQAEAKEAPASPLMRIIRPEARDRWTHLATRGVEPDEVERILVGALAGEIESQWRLFDLMEDTWPRCKKNLNEVKRAVQSAQWSAAAWAEADQKPSERALERARFAEAAIWGMRPDRAEDEGNFRDLIYDTMDAYGKGLSVVEILWERRMGAGIVPRACQFVHPRHYGYPTDVAGLRLSPSGSKTDWMPFPQGQFVIAVAKTKSGHPLGGAMLRSLATLWCGANFAWDWLVNLAQIFGLPFRWATYDPSNPAVVEDICDMLENLGSAGWAAFPAGTTLDFKEAVQRAADNPQSFVMDVADIGCDILVLGQTLTTSQGDRGSQSLGTVHEGVRADVLEHAGSWVAQELSDQVIRPLIGWNYGDQEEVPWLQCDFDEEWDEVAAAQRDSTLLAAGVAMPKAWLYERHGIPMPGEGDEVIVGGNGGGGPDESGQRPDGGKPPVEAKGARRKDPREASREATARIGLAVAEKLTGVSRTWLGPVIPVFAHLVELALDGNVSDEDFETAIVRAADALPELAPYMDADALATAMEEAMAPALVNGVWAGVRRGAR